MPKKATIKVARQSCHRASWKTVAKRRTYSHRLKLLFLSLAGILVSALVFGGVYVVAFLKSPVTQASGSFPEGRIWDEVTSMNLVLVLEDDNNQLTSLAILTLDSFQKRLSIVTLPVNALVAYPLGLGEAPVSQALTFGEKLEPKIGVEMFSKLTLRNLALPLDRYIIVKSSSLSALASDPKDFKEWFRVKNLPDLPAKISWFRENANTNLSLTEMYQVGNFIRAVNPSDIKMASFDSWDSGAVDSHFAAFFGRGFLKQTRVPVMVLNGSNREGLGRWGGQLIANLGGDTLAFNNAVNNYANSFVIAENPDLPIVKALGRTLNISSIYPKGQGLAEREFNAGRAEVTLVLGLDAGQIM